MHCCVGGIGLVDDDSLHGAVVLVAGEHHIPWIHCSYTEYHHNTTAEAEVAEDEGRPVRSNSPTQIGHLQTLPGPPAAQHLPHAMDCKRTSAHVPVEDQIPNYPIAGDGRQGGGREDASGESSFPTVDAFRGIREGGAENDSLPNYPGSHWNILSADLHSPLGRSSREVVAGEDRRC